MDSDLEDYHRKNTQLQAQSGERIGGMRGRFWFGKKKDLGRFQKLKTWVTDYFMLVVVGEEDRRYFEA